MEFKQFLSELVASIDFKRIKWNEILSALIVAVFAGVIIIPSIHKCIENGSRNKCSSSMYVIMDELSQHISSEDTDGKWHDMVINGKSDKALEILVDEALENRGRKIDIENYYFEKRDNKLYIRCMEHQDIMNRNMIIIGMGEEEEEKDFGTFGWNSNTDRKIENVTTLGGSSFVIDAGLEGKYCVSAWNWTDYTSGEAAGDGKVYGASMIFYDNTYYYYPDGFKVLNSTQNSSPLRYAADPDDERQEAYCIAVDTDSIVSGRFSTESHEGSLMVEENNIYIWQTRPSKTQSKGWIKLECETKKL